MRLGDVSKNDIVTLYNSQFEDFLKIWLFTEGSLNILKFIYQKRKIPFKNITGHICDICAEIFKDPENITTLKRHYREVSSKILFKYSLKIKTILTSKKV
jgi:hypothetical protein